MSDFKSSLSKEEKELIQKKGQNNTLEEFKKDK